MSRWTISSISTHLNGRLAEEHETLLQVFTPLTVFLHLGENGPWNHFYPFDKRLRLDLFSITEATEIATHFRSQLTQMKLVVDLLVFAMIFINRFQVVGNLFGLGKRSFVKRRRRVVFRLSRFESTIKEINQRTTHFNESGLPSKSGSELSSKESMFEYRVSLSKWSWTYCLATKEVSRCSSWSRSTSSSSEWFDGLTSSSLSSDSVVAGAVNRTISSRWIRLTTLRLFCRRRRFELNDSIFKRRTFSQQAHTQVRLDWMNGWGDKSMIYLKQEYTEMKRNRNQPIHHIRPMHNHCTGHFCSDQRCNAVYSGSKRFQR